MKLQRFLLALAGLLLLGVVFLIQHRDSLARVANPRREIQVDRRSEARWNRRLSSPPSGLQPRKALERVRRDPFNTLRNGPPTRLRGGGGRNPGLPR